MIQLCSVFVQRRVHRNIVSKLKSQISNRVKNMAYTFVDLLLNVPVSPEFSFEPFDCYESDPSQSFNLQINDEGSSYLIRSDSTPEDPSDLDGLRIMVDKLSEKLKKHQTRHCCIIMHSGY
jgi:hypothetical protein